jgi:hypothetical protein
MFVNCPTLSTDAAAYLLLAQNKFQAAVQYEVTHYWIYGHSLHKNPSRLDKIREILSEKFILFERLGRAVKTKLELIAAPQFGSTVSRKNWFEPTSKAISDYDRWFSGCTYNKFDSDPCPTIVVTEAQIEGGYIGLSKDNVALISLANWKNYFRPGSALEYLLLRSATLCSPPEFRINWLALCNSRLHLGFPRSPIRFSDLWLFGLSMFYVRSFARTNGFA